MAANETIVLNQEELVVRIVGYRLTAFPSTGTILSLERNAPRASVVAGLFGTSAFNIVRSNLYTLSLNLLPHSSDDDFCRRAADAIEISNRILAVTIKYQSSQWASNACVFLNDPVRNMQADTVEPLTWQLVGNFPIRRPIKFVNPGTLTADEITATP